MKPERLHALLDRQRWTQKHAAELCWVNVRTMRRWLSGDEEIPFWAWDLLTLKARVDFDFPGDAAQPSAA